MSTLTTTAVHIHKQIYDKCSELSQENPRICRCFFGHERRVINYHILYQITRYLHAGMYQLSPTPDCPCRKDNILIIFIFSAGVISGVYATEKKVKKVRSEPTPIPDRVEKAQTMPPDPDTLLSDHHNTIDVYLSFRENKINMCECPPGVDPSRLTISMVSRDVTWTGSHALVIEMWTLESSQRDLVSAMTV